MVCCGLPVERGVGHHAPSIRLGNLDFSITLSLESHRHLRTTIIDSIFVRDPFLSYIPHRHVAHPAETAIEKRFQLDLSSSFSAQLSLPQESPY
jgi:hypothetical protein